MKRIKILSVLLIALLLMQSFSAQIFADEAVPIYVSLDSNSMEFEVPPIIENGRTLLPIRAIVEAIGADVIWNEESQTVNIKRAATEIEIVIGQQNALVNGEKILLDVPAKIIDGRTMLPLRFISENLSQYVAYQDRYDSIWISIYEDISFVGESNIKSWILGM